MNTAATVWCDNGQWFWSVIPEDPAKIPTVHGPFRTEIDAMCDSEKFVKTAGEHTQDPGPWRAEPLSVPGVFDVTGPLYVNSRGNMVSRVIAQRVDGFNVSLISKAPDIKKALQNLYNEMDTHFLSSNEARELLGYGF